MIYPALHRFDRDSALTHGAASNRNEGINTVAVSINFRFFAFELNASSLFIRLPFIGQAFLSTTPGFTSCDSWRTLRATGEV